MNKHLVMIVGNFFPKPSPTGKCAEAYVDLLKDQYDISVICQADTDQVPYIYNGKQVYPVADAYTLFQHRLEKRESPWFLQNLAKIPVHLIRPFIHPNLLYSYVGKAQEQLERIHSKRRIDVIFSVGAPTAAHVAARNFRREHPEVRWITYTVDSYAAQNKGNPKALAFESAVLGASDYVLLSEEIYNSSPELYASFADKCGVLPYLMPPAPLKTEGEHFFDTDKTNLVYAGRFYKAIRNPEYLLQLALEMDESCVLHLYCQSDCDSMIDNYVRCSDGRIVRHKPVSVEEIQRIYMQADVLVNVGNNTPEFKPSKTFEYIASGKPIVNIFYESQRDEVLAITPVSLQLSRGTTVTENVTLLNAFMGANHGRSLSREEIDSLFPKHSPGSIRNILELVIKKDE